MTQANLKDGPSYIQSRRIAAGWEYDPDHGWSSPEGLHEHDWIAEGWPLPEEPDFEDWFKATYHYDAQDSGVDCNPFPNAPADAGE